MKIVILWLCIKVTGVLLKSTFNRESGISSVPVKVLLVIGVSIHIQ